MTPMTPELLSSIISDVYDCALEPAGWSATLTRINTAADAAYVAIALTDEKMQAPTFFATSPWDVAQLHTLARDFAPLNHPGLREITLNDVDVSQSTMSAMSESVFQTTRFYQEWAKPQGLRDGSAVTFVRSERQAGLLTLITRDTRDIIGPEELRFMALLSPHLRRAAMIGDLLDQTSLQAGLYRAALDSLAAPVLLVDAASLIVYANAGAEAMLAAGKPVSQVAGRLAPANAAMVEGLADAVRRTVGDPARDLRSRGIGLPVSASNQEPAVAYVLPLQHGTVRGRLGPAMAAVFVRTRGATQPPGEEVLATLYDLTRAEARLLQRLGLGETAATISTSQGISEHTVKSQLQRVFVKTGLHRQADLVRLVADLSPPAV